MRSNDFPEQLCRPLGVGYDGYPAFLRQYVQPANSFQRNPDLGVSLAGLQQAGSFSTFRPQLRSAPRCLIQGITSPRNGTCLREFLETRGITQAAIEAIDIADVGALLKAMSLSLPDVQFSVADAANLPSFATGSVQILVQDHLLNCAPHGIHEAIIREAARLLDPNGFLILNFSVSPRTAAGKLRTRAEIESMLGRPLSDTAYCLRDLIGDPEERNQWKAALSGQIVALDAGRLILITPPDGNFEFYFSKEELEARLARHGLCFALATNESGIDSNGTCCTRYRTLVRHGE